MNALREYSQIEREIIDMQQAVVSAETRVTRLVDMGGPYTQITLPNGRIITVWDEAAEDEGKACVQVFESAADYDAGNVSVDQII